MMTDKAIEAAKFLGRGFIVSAFDVMTSMETYTVEVYPDKYRLFLHEYNTGRRVFVGETDNLVEIRGFLNVRSELPNVPSNLLGSK